MHHKTVEAVGDLNLAGKATIVFRLTDTVEQIGFHLTGRFDFIDPIRVYIAVAGGAATRATALGDNAVDHIVNGSLHQAAADLQIDFLCLAIGLDVSDSGHN